MWSLIDLCFMCSKDSKCNVVDNKIVTQVEYLMPEITIIKMKLSLRICFICEKNLQLFNTFKQDCVENSIRLEARIKEARDNTDIQEKCTTSETYINKIHEVFIKEEPREEVLDQSDTPTVKDFFVEEIYIKENPLQEKLYESEVGDEFQDTLKENSPPQTDTHLHEASSVDINDESNRNSDNPDDVVSVNNEINIEENILVSGSPDQKTYTCLICNKTFKDLSYLKIRHMNIHMGKKDFQCNECKKWFSDKSHLNRHMKQHTGVKDFQCNECKKWFTRKSSLDTHMKQHTGVKDFQCIECKKWFSQKANLATHMKQHTGVKEYHCNECKRWFLNKSNFAKHMKQHTGIKDFQCHICNKMFYHKTNLTRHIKIHAEINSTVD